MTESESKRAFTTKNAPFSLIFLPVLVPPSRRLEQGFVTKCLRFVVIRHPNAKGRAHVTFYKISRPTQISISAAGQAQDGTLLWNEVME